MTARQYQEKTKAARKEGSAIMPGGSMLIYSGDNFGNAAWAVIDKNGNTVDTAGNENKLKYIFV